MTSTLQWTVLAVCVVCTAWRIPSLIKGHNRGLFWAFAITSLCVALSIPAIYMPLDGLLGGRNLANVIVRLGVFSAFFLLARKVAAAYKSPLAATLIQGPVGLIVLAGCSLGIWISYFLSDLQGSNTGLIDFGDQPSVAAYMWFGVAYTAYGAGVLVLPTARATVSSRRAIDRAAAACLCLGFFLVFLRVPLQLLSLPDESVIHPITFGSILFVAAGLALVWVSFMRRPLQRRATL